MSVQEMNDENRRTAMELTDSQISYFVDNC
jgi:hypothetical protein